MTAKKTEYIAAVQCLEMHQPPLGYPCWHTVSDAACAMGVDESDVVEAIRERTRVRTIEGPAVAGMVMLQCGQSETGYLPYFE